VINSWQNNGVSIVIPTYKRPEDVVRALKSIESQAMEQTLCEIVVVDNDPKHSAKIAVNDFIRKSPARITFVHEPNPGVSNARNTALQHAKGRFIAFLDDDMEAQSGWLRALLEASRNYQAGLVFGPVVAVMPENENPIYTYMSGAFDRIPYSENGYIEKGVATGGCLADRKATSWLKPVFDPALNQTGGEDDVFFSFLLQKGVKAYWTNDAKCLEHVPEKRATLSYVWKRNFAFGQSPAQEASEKGIVGLPKVLFWMAVGGAQSLIALPGLAIYSITGSPKRVRSLVKLAQGVGKIFWMKTLSPKLYGN
jgi:glycosyltransferase involved in cell wall biosynthesis